VKSRWDAKILSRERERERVWLLVGGGVGEQRAMGREPKKV
jgi:hypothetical protein